MKRLLPSILAAMFIILSLSSFAQGNQPVGNLVYAPDGKIYGAFTRTLPDLRRPSTIYSYTPGASTIDPIFRMDDHILEVHAADSNGYLYGTAVNFHAYDLRQRYQSRIFRLKNDGTEFHILRSGYITNWGAHSSLVIVNEFIYGILPGGYGYEPGKVFRINKNDGSNYTIIQDFPTVSERATSLLPQSEDVEIEPGTYRGGGIIGFWTATTAGGAFGKGSVVGRDFYGIPNRDPLNLEGYEGDFYTGEGPVSMFYGYAKQMLAVAQRGGRHNQGVIFALHKMSDIPIFHFPPQYGQPFGKPFSNDSTLMIYGLGGNFDNNTGFIYSLNQSTNDFFPLATFDQSSFVNGVTSVVSHFFPASLTEVIYGTSRSTGSDTENGSLFAINADGSQPRVIAKFIDGYSKLLDPADGYAEASVTPSLRALNGLEGATNYGIEISESSDFTGTVHVVNSPDGLGKLNSPVLKYSTTYYARVKTNLVDDFGAVTTFTTHAPEKYSFVSSPVHGAINIPVVSTKVTANIVYGATSYTIELNTAPDFTGTSIVKSSSLPNQRTITFDGLQPSTTYYTRTKTNFPSDWGPTRSFTTAGGAPPPMFVAEAREMNIYPNPFEHTFTIDPNGSEDINVSLVDLTGRELIKTQVTQSTALGDQLAPGIYVLRIKEKDGSISVRRMVKK